MINISEGELLDLLPSQMNNDTDMICLSYAIKAVTDKILEDEVYSMIMNMIDRLPEKIIDVMAVEWRTQYYDQSLDIEVKRELVKKTFLWHAKAGTVSAVKELIATVFGEAELIEWWDFDEGERDPGYFDIETDAQTSFDEMSRFNAMIRMVKNVRSHLRRILTRQELFQNDYIGVVSYGYCINPVIDQAFTMSWDPIQQKSSLGQGAYGYYVNPPIHA